MRPTCSLVLALYGHPDAGGYWERDCERRITDPKMGWKKLSEEWPSGYWHDEKKAMLIVYVDDFKMAAREKDNDELWKALK